MSPSLGARWELSGLRPAASLHTVDWHGSHRPGGLTRALSSLGAVAAGVPPAIRARLASLLLSIVRLLFMPLLLLMDTPP